MEGSSGYDRLREDTWDEDVTLSLKENFGLFAVVLVLVFVYLGRGETGLRVY